MSSTESCTSRSQRRTATSKALFSKVVQLQEQVVSIHNKLDLVLGGLAIVMDKRETNTADPSYRTPPHRLGQCPRLVESAPDDGDESTTSPDVGKLALCQNTSSTSLLATDIPDIPIFPFLTTEYTPRIDMAKFAFPPIHSSSMMVDSVQSDIDGVAFEVISQSRSAEAVVQSLAVPFVDVVGCLDDQDADGISFHEDEDEEEFQSQPESCGDPLDVVPKMPFQSGPSPFGKPWRPSRSSAKVWRPLLHLSSPTFASPGVWTPSAGLGQQVQPLWTNLSSDVRWAGAAGPTLMEADPFIDGDGSLNNEYDSGDENGEDPELLAFLNCTWHEDM